MIESKPSILSLKSGLRMIVKETLCELENLIGNSAIFSVNVLRMEEDMSLKTTGRALVSTCEVEFVGEVSMEPKEKNVDPIYSLFEKPVQVPRTEISVPGGEVSVLESYDEVIAQIDAKKQEEDYDDLASIKSKSLELSAFSVGGDPHRILLNPNAIYAIYECESRSDDVIEECSF